MKIKQYYIMQYLDAGEWHDDVNCDEFPTLEAVQKAIRRATPLYGIFRPVLRTEIVFDTMIE